MKSVKLPEQKLKGTSKQPSNEDADTKYRVTFKGGVSTTWELFWGRMWDNADYNTANPFYELRQEAKSIDYEEARLEMQGRYLFKNTLAIIHGFKTFKVEKAGGDEIFEGFGKPTMIVSESFSTQAQQILAILNPKAFDGNGFDQVSWNSEVNRYVDCLVLPPTSKGVNDATGDADEGASTSQEAASKVSTSKEPEFKQPLNQPALSKPMSSNAPKIKVMLSTEQPADLLDATEPDEAIILDLFIEPGHKLEQSHDSEDDSDTDLTEVVGQK